MFYYPNVSFTTLLFVFLGVAFFCRKELRLYILLICIVYTFILYTSIAELLGRPKPINNYTPFYSFHYTKDQKIPLLHAVVKDNIIYLLLQEDTIKLYSIPYNQNFADELNKALTKTNGKFDGLFFGMSVSSIGGGSHVLMASPQKDLSVPKLDTNTEGNITDYGNH
jgi:hypothetical protein